jgi:hypothetical protein
MKNIPLTKSQIEIMQEFYSKPSTKVVYDKKERNNIWKMAKQKKDVEQYYDLENECPALKIEIDRSYESGNKVQSAIFSECVYAQTLANIFDLKKFNNCRKNADHIPQSVLNLLKSYSLVPRYSYSSDNYNRMIIQAGGNDGVDSAIIEVEDLVVYTIEFKEPNAKTSEPDLPKYGENGKFIMTEKFQSKYPHFVDMFKQHLNKNIFECMGSNINEFTFESVNRAVSENYFYSKKYADVCCTEDKEGYLTMIPVNQIKLWAEIGGEIRPSGRNHKPVWTPKALKKIIKQKGGKIKNDILELAIEKINIRKKRGGDNEISGYKINHLFFVYKENVIIENNILKCKIEDIRQLIPTITAKMDFKNLKHNDVKLFYKL